MKVRELIEALQKMPPDSDVVSEGCDCEGDVVGVEARHWNERTDETGNWVDDVLLRRKL